VDNFTRESVRLCLLRLLNEAPGRTANESVLHSSIQSFGFAISRDRLVTELSWLKEQGALMLGEIAGLTIATGNVRTDDIVNDRAQVPGIQRPRPKA
tara:strand:+ start:13880 stop:14170 length:291 start_codon:yes stop_codon:yes gene_type:complete